MCTLAGYGHCKTAVCMALYWRAYRDMGVCIPHTILSHYAHLQGSIQWGGGEASPPNVPAKDFVNDFFLIPPMHRRQVNATTKTQKYEVGLLHLSVHSSRFEWAPPIHI